jgi:cytochrome c oxidase subunit III
MNLLRQLLEKPWEPAGAVVALPSGRAFATTRETVAVRVLLGVVTVLFSLLIAAYAVRMAFEDWRPVPEQWLLWLTTAFLLASSLAFHAAWVGIRDGRLDRARLGMLAGGGLALAFFAGQLAAWRQLNGLPIFDITNPAIAFFYLITALHALHLAGGLVAWSVAFAVVRDGQDLGRAARLVRLCATYWHYLLGVWLVLFALLFSGNDHLDIILSICGLR